MNTTSPQAWDAFTEFVNGFAAARELHARAGNSGSFVECVCLGASLVDALLRVGLVLQHQLEHSTREIPLGLVFQGPLDHAISEREIYKRARSQDIIDESTFDGLQRLYDDRNRVIHRYIISRITTSDVLDIAIRYENMVQLLSDRIHRIEEQQIEQGVGITVTGPALEGDEGRRFVEDLADKKHKSVLGKIIRDS
jgi:hypothetical protein